MDKAIKNITSERIVIGILLNSPEHIIEISNVVKAEYFYMTAHKIIMHIISALINEGVENIDSMVILARAEKISNAVEVLNQNGGIEYLEEIKYLAEGYSLEDLRLYAEEVATCSYKREVIAKNETINSYIETNRDLSMSQVETRLQENQYELSNKYKSGKQLKMLGEIFDDVWDKIVSRRTGDGITGLPSKIPLVNNYFTYEAGELIVIGARAKFGKTNWVINEMHNLAVLNGIPIADFDTEMSTETFLLRMLALDSGVSIQEIKTGFYLNDDRKVKAVENSKARIKNAPLFHKFDPFWDMAKISNTAKLLKLRHDIQMLVFDYIKVPEVTGNVKEHSMLGNYTISLKNLAGILEIPILTLAQLSPFERRLADSDKINRYASTIAYLLPKSLEEIKRDFGAEQGGTDFLYVDYNRNGKDMTKTPDMGINLSYTRYLAKFEQADYQPLDDDYSY